MIADELGVTKAAVYHQYHTKEEIVRAVALSEIAWVEAVLEIAEAEPNPTRAREAAISGIVDLAVARRRQVSTLLTDPIIGKLFAKDKRLLGVLDRLHRLLMGSAAGPDSQVATAMLIAAISGATIHPLVVGLDDDALRTQLLRLARRFLGLRT
jgi:AcrR family transcriptional regulator